MSDPNITNTIQIFQQYPQCMPMNTGASVPKSIFDLIDQNNKRIADQLSVYKDHVQTTTPAPFAPSFAPASAPSPSLAPSFAPASSSPSTNTLNVGIVYT